MFYPLAGWLGANAGLSTAAVALGVCALLGAAGAMVLWPRRDPAVLTHTHDALVHEHGHIHDAHHSHDHLGAPGAEGHTHRHSHATLTHAHAFVIDDHHTRWPRPA